MAADRALSDVMHKLKLYTSGMSLSPIKDRRNKISPLKQSRWSDSSEESRTTGDGWKPRRSGESVRSGKSRMTVKSKKSAWSLKSRRSEEGDRPSLDQMEVPPMPTLKVTGEQREKVMPVTPSRGRRVVEGLARRLGLTPKKKV